MWKLIKKWWLVDQLKKTIALHSTKGSIDDISSGEKVLLTHKFFVIGTDEYPGLARRSLDIYLWTSKEQYERELKGEIHEYNEIINSCINGNEKYMTRNEQGFLNTTPLAEDISGITGLLELLLRKYDKLTSFLLGGGIVGLVWLIDYLLEILDK